MLPARTERHVRAGSLALRCEFAGMCNKNPLFNDIASAGQEGIHYVTLQLSSRTHMPKRSEATRSPYFTRPQAFMLTTVLVLPDGEDPCDSIFFIISRPSTTCPKTTCLPSSQGVFTVVMKNWLPFVFRPLLAMDNKPGFLCLSLKFSSGKVLP